MIPAAPSIGGRRAVFSLVLLFSLGCGGDPPPRDLDTLAVRDSLYVEPETESLYNGPVYRDFADAPGEIQLAGRLSEGTWDGEMLVYHRNGAIRYMGSFHEGSRCGPWTENADSVRNQSIYQELVDEIESLGVYPPCPEG
ncbi:MAG: hypothetical protein HKN72_11455 [Gemmatimonadetes bacterium]|nr:hypothetical protein [Gemmatimonadota bacterium]NNF13835.1 hypothetical protein [Gemmatimonadota bacterium]NNL29468.1 hypothetical protein [Gemmatimonadota bacterium]